MGHWTIAAVQMDVVLARKEENLTQVRARLREASAAGARLIVFPECAALTGYCFESRAEALPYGEPVPGPSTDAIARECRLLGVWAVVGLLEISGDALFNACVLVGPEGLKAVHRKIHLPFLGVDRFLTPGDRPFAVHAVEDLNVGMAICYDDSFPESARTLMLLGADLVVLPTNWPPMATRVAKLIVPARALENQVYYAVAGRIGVERGVEFIGRSRIADCFGQYLAVSEDAQPTVLYADIDPAQARDKHLVFIPGAYEVDRTADRRPEMYSLLTRPK